MMEYLKTLGISELINFLEIESDSENFEMVGEILSSREEQMTKHVEDLEKSVKMYKTRCCELSNTLEEVKKSDIEEERKRFKELEKMSELVIGKLEKDLEVYKAKCSDLGVELREKEEKTKEVEGKIEEFKKYKMVSDELQEKVKIVTEREKAALENVAALSGDMEKMTRKRNVEIGEFKRSLECEKQKAVDEMRDEKKRYTELENQSKVAVWKLKNDLEMQKWKCSELSRELEEKEKKNIELQSKLQELDGYELMCGQLKHKVACLEDAVLELENELEMKKWKCSELSLALEEKEQKSIEMQSKLEAFKKYEIMCEQLKDKVSSLEENCKIVGERKKALIDSNTALLAVLEKVRRGSDAQLIELKTKNKDLECAKLKLEDELKDQMERIKELEKTKGILIEVETDLEMYKGRCSYLLTKLEEEKQHSISVEVKLGEIEKYKTACNELKEKVSHLEEDCKIASERERSLLDRITDLTGELEKTSVANSQELNELKEKNKDLEFAKQKAKNEVKAQNERYTSIVPAKSNCEVGAEDKVGETDKNELGIIESETNEPLNAASSPKLKTELKDLNFMHDGEARDHMCSVSICNSAAKAGPVTVSTLKRKRRRTRSSRKCDGKKQRGQDSTCRRCGDPSHFIRVCPWYREKNTRELVPDRGHWDQKQLSGNTVPLQLPAPPIAAHGGKKHCSDNFSCRRCGDLSHYIRDCPWYKDQNTGRLVPKLATTTVLPHNVSLFPRSTILAETLQDQAVPLPPRAPVIAAHGGGKHLNPNFTCRRCGDPSHFVKDCPW